MTKAQMSSSCAAPPANPEAVVISGEEHATPGPGADALAEEISEFIAHRILDPDAQFFDG
jgi:hypothetical protein